MQTRRNVVTGLCSLALVLAPVAAPLARMVAEEPWEIVPEDNLRDLRGGMDFGDLVASFAIQRVVEIDGVVVARMQLVISNLDRLANGGMPTITITGPIAEIVQFMQTAGNVSVAGNNAGIPSSVASLAATDYQTGPSMPAPPAASAAAARSTAAAGAGATATAAAPATPTASGNSGTVSATGTQSGSMAQMGSAVANAVTAAANATSQPASTSGATATASPSTGSLTNTPVNTAATSSAANAPAIAAPNTHLQASAASPVTQPVSAQAASTSALQASTTKTIPVGTTGQVVVLSNLPNATALTTAIQNQVHAATIQTQTTISATINSMPSLNAISLGNSIRAQVSGGG
jgi:hypothetical protein